MKKSILIYISFVVILAMLAWIPMLADYRGWIAYDRIIWFTLFSGPPYGIMIIGQDLLVRPWLADDLPDTLQVAVWLFGTFLYYTLILAPSATLLIRRPEGCDRSGTLGLQFFFLLFHGLCVYISILMLRT